MCEDENPVIGGIKIVEKIDNFNIVEEAFLLSYEFFSYGIKNYLYKKRWILQIN